MTPSSTKAWARCRLVVTRAECGTLIAHRFSSVPLPDLRHKLEGQTKELESDVTKLNQRLLYLETTHKNSREHIEQMLRGR